jgi:hypothetical protein
VFSHPKKSNGTANSRQSKNRSEIKKAGNGKVPEVFKEYLKLSKTCSENRNEVDQM